MCGWVALLTLPDLLFMSAQYLSTGAVGIRIYHSLQNQWGQTRLVIRQKRSKYHAEKLVNRTVFDTVRSKAGWLPDQGSNLGPAD